MKKVHPVRLCAGMLVALALLLPVTASAEIRQIRMIDIKSALDSGGVQLTVEPSFGGDSTEAGSRSIPSF